MKLSKHLYIPQHRFLKNDSKGELVLGIRCLQHDLAVQQAGSGLA